MSVRVPSNIVVKLSAEAESSKILDEMNILYKYVTHNRALTCIPEVGNGTLRATQPAALNDPFECAVTPMISHINQTEVNLELANVLTEINARKPITEEDVLSAKAKHGSQFLRHLVSQQLSTAFGIVSFSVKPFHPLMWSHYAGDGSGFVIGYDKEEIGRLTAIDGGLQSVYYGGRPPRILEPTRLISPTFNLLALLSIKSSHWSYEDEWRLIVGLNQTIGTGVSDQLGQPINLVRVPNEAVVSVHYTKRTPPKSVKLIAGRLADKNNRYRAERPRKLVMSNSSYGYEEASDDQQLLL